MAATALLVIALFGATGDPSFPATVTETPTLVACRAQAKATVEALAALYGERAMPSPAKSGRFEAFEDERGVWMVRYDRQVRADPDRAEPAVSRTIRATCRAVEG
ncbi:hypothetical protein STAQ_39090 [Allostella sp. ATCC 35155]|nr:hypothetical protein STAQ_39090 [Stella sp. ATCC 35155]